MPARWRRDIICEMRAFGEATETERQCRTELVLPQWIPWFLPVAPHRTLNLFLTLSLKKPTSLVRTYTSTRRAWYGSTAHKGIPFHLEPPTSVTHTSKRLRADCSFALSVSAGSSLLGQTDYSWVSSGPKSCNKTATATTQQTKGIQWGGNTGHADYGSIRCGYCEYEPNI